MATTTAKRRQRGCIRPNGAGFQVRVYAGRDPVTKKDLYLYAQAPDETEAEKARTRLLHQVDEQRHPKQKATMGFLLDRWLSVTEQTASSYERAEGLIRTYLKPAFGDLQVAKLTVEMVDLFYARLRRCREQCEGRRRGRTDPQTRTEHVCRKVTTPHTGAPATSRLPLEGASRGWPGNRRRSQVCVRCTSRCRMCVAKVEGTAAKLASGGNRERESRLLAPNTRRGLRRRPSRRRVQC
ncbi:hypothetical protein OK074_4497 [Actinobacteria bacterium OK074]|nr:hypothetical protein OK074_4497 [Actinobacteria bacterium OK074]